MAKMQFAGTKSVHLRSFDHSLLSLSLSGHHPIKPHNKNVYAYRLFLKSNIFYLRLARRPGEISHLEGLLYLIFFSFFLSFF